MTNPWLDHVAKFRKQHPEFVGKDLFIEARKTYVPTKTRKGGQLFGLIDDSNLLPGEHHGVLKTKKGLKRANYMGPGTNLETRIKRGDKGLTEVDKASKAHDLRYTLSKGRKDEIAADKKMIRVVDRISKEGKDSSINIAQAKLIKLKDTLGLPADLFTKIGTDPNNELFKKELRKLEQQGYGVKRSKM